MRSSFFFCYNIWYFLVVLYFVSIHMVRWSCVLISANFVSFINISFLAFLISINRLYEFTYSLEMLNRFRWRPSGSKSLQLSGNFLSVLMYSEEFQYLNFQLSHYNFACSLVMKHVHSPVITSDKQFTIPVCLRG